MLLKCLLFWYVAYVRYGLGCYLVTDILSWNVSNQLQPHNIPEEQTHWWYFRRIILAGIQCRIVVCCDMFLTWLVCLSYIFRGSVPTFPYPALFLLLPVYFHCHDDNHCCCKFYLQRFSHDWGVKPVTVRTGHSSQSRLSSTCLQT